MKSSKVKFKREKRENKGKQSQISFLLICLKFFKHMKILVLQVESCLKCFIEMTCLKSVYRVRVVMENLEKSWNLKKVFPGLEKSWKTRKMPKVMENENDVSNNLMII